jgi:hypothetical protein
MNIIINPGTGPVTGATLENADENIRQFVQDLRDGLFRDGPDHCEFAKIFVRRGDTSWDEDGRFAFVIWGKTVDGQDWENEIDMPGLPLDQVRWIDGPDQNIWDFPRLYVDGSSWAWKFALSSAGYFQEEDDE